MTEPKEPAPPAEATTKEGVQEAVDKARASKAGQVGKLDGGDAEGTGMMTRQPLGEGQANLPFSAVLPEVTSKEPTLTPENYPSTTETAAEESAMSTAATMQPEPKTSEAAATEPAVAPAETNGAHVKRPYEKPIFTEDEMKPHKMAKHEEEAPKKAENGTHKASPAAVAAAAAAIGSSTKTPEKEKSTAAPAADASERDPKLPEKVFKPGEEPAREAPKSEPVKEEPVKAKEESKKTEAAAAGEPAEHKKEKGGFFSWLKRKFK